MAELAGRQKKIFVCQVFMRSSKQFVFWFSFWLQTAAAVDYIMFNFDNFSISNLRG
jgi:hypothetical protein